MGVSKCLDWTCNLVFLYKVPFLIKMYILMHTYQLKCYPYNTICMCVQEFKVFNNSHFFFTELTTIEGKFL